MERFVHYKALAELFRYPDSSSVELGRACQSILDQVNPEAGTILRPFTDYYVNQTEDGREELYTKTFDVQPICYLDLGYVIFGEDYKRGSFLLHMQDEQRKIGRECSPELPDNLYHVLHLMVIHPEEEFVNELAAKIVIPAVRLMIREFESAKVDLKMKVIRKLHNAIIQEELNTGNVYQNAFKALLIVLENDFAKAIVTYNPTEENLVNDSFFNKNGSVNQLVNNLKLD